MIVQRAIGECTVEFSTGFRPDSATDFDFDFDFVQSAERTLNTYPTQAHAIPKTVKIDACNIPSNCNKFFSPDMSVTRQRISAQPVFSRRSLCTDTSRHHACCSQW
jgi:hypothetical protein